MDNKTVVLLTTITVIAAIASLAIIKKDRRSENPPVAPGSYPFFGHALTLAQGSRVFFKAFFADTDIDLLEIDVAGKRGYVVRGVENTRKILTATQLNTRYLPKDALIEIGEYHQGILFNSDIESWKYNRKMLVESIARPRFIRSLAPKINSYLANIYPLLDKLAESKTPFLPNMLFGSMSLDVIVDIILTNNRHAAESYLQTCIDGKTRKNDILLDLVKGTMEATGFFANTPSLLYKYFPSYIQKAEKYRKVIREFEECTRELFTAKQQEKQQTAMDENVAEIAEDLASGLVLAVKSGMALNNAIEVIKSIIAGGTDTSSNTMSFLLYELACNPEIKNEIHTEVAALIADSENSEFDSQNIEQLPLLQAAILEISRMYSEAQYLLRDVQIDGFTLGGTVLQKDSLLFIWIQGNQLSSELWEKPEVFNPKRFLESKELGGPFGYGFSYASFGHGIRKCPGEALALMEMKLIMANLCLRYDFELVDPTKQLEIKDNLALECGNYEVIFKHRI
ncbi:hypothetical protein HK100_008355 [Physocladia obscura]|uniref:Cytochrome P450 n=1 Tax=Physocladia obscura TaxID=109957 RepID=A0AAD5SMZ4_9FUNG|nr:hypothetical protein HK100_008355 [Physocladia obscura]